MDENLVVNVKNITKKYDNNIIFKDISFSLNKGEKVAILGLGGCGKSTLLKSIIGLVPPNEGEINILSQNIYKISTEQKMILLKKIGMAFQQGALFDFMTVRENIEFALDNMTITTKQEQKELIISMLADVNLSDAIDKIPSELSGGMRRRVGIVRAIIINPLLVLLDEPTAGLDPITTSIIINMIHKLAKKANTTLLCATSIVDVAFKIADRIIILNDNEIIADDTNNNLLETKNDWLKHFLTIRKQ